MRIRTILVPTDFSEPAGVALRYAGMLARELKSRIHLFHVITPPSIYDSWVGEPIPANVAVLLTESEEWARRRLQKLVPRSAARGKTIVTGTEIGRAANRILEYITAHHIDLVIMGTHGRGIIGRALLGSVAARIVQRSPVPVLTVHGPERPTAPRARPRRPRGRTLRRDAVPLAPIVL